MPWNRSGRLGTRGPAEKGETIVTASDGDTSVPDYTMGYSEDYIQFLSSERAQYAIAFLEPQLSAGLRLLDLGSGPGHVTAALAQRVAPGETIGIDINPSQLEAARALASGQAGANLSFELADAARLPFADGSFDVVSCCDLLAYQTAPYCELLRSIPRPPHPRLGAGCPAASESCSESPLGRDRPRFA
ncbi:MAG: class I SAM-dependent methyltransferase [Rhodothermaceae bacterium]|nr:class I SAM-dependent methyltransferase [Rhodothermaceae bacterium]